MRANETSGQETGGRTDIEITVCSNGVVNIHRPESDRAHSVFVGESGDVLRCSCKGHYYRGHCARQEAIESRPLVMASAQAAANTVQRVATDGGQAVRGEGDELPEIEVISRAHTGRPLRGRCTGCDATGPAGLGDNWIILHGTDCERDAPHEEDNR